MIVSRSRRSVLYVPASNQRALEKAATLTCDAIIIDLEDAVAPGDKAAAREALRAWFRETSQSGKERIIRINALASEWGTEDLLAARACLPDAILLPKVDTPQDIEDASHALEETDAPDSVRLWAMIETARGMMNLGAISELGLQPSSRLGCFVAGMNDLVKETGLIPGQNRNLLQPWLLQIVLAARAGGLDVLDGVSNQFRDLAAFAEECEHGRSLGFDGKTLIHPAQIEAANLIFSPGTDEIAEAKAIVEAFARTENAALGVIQIDGQMVERLHLEQAETLLAKAALTDSQDDEAP